MGDALTPLGQKIRAYKYTYDVQAGHWEKSSVKVSMSRQPFEEGGMRFCFRATEHDKNGDLFDCVVKVFKPEPNAAEEEYFDEAKTQMIAESYAQDFNRKSRNHKVAFLPVHVLQLQGHMLAGSKLCAMEPYLRGDYVKHNDNSGAVETNEAIPQAFSHFTYEASNRLMVVCDIQGVQDFYTDPQIHSFDGEGFGSGNLGATGLQRFLDSHACTCECEALGLQNLRPDETDEQMARRLQAEEMRVGPGPSTGDADADAAVGGGGYLSDSSSDSDSFNDRRQQGFLENAMRALRFQ